MMLKFIAIHLATHTTIQTYTNIVYKYAIAKGKYLPMTQHREIQ